LSGERPMLTSCESTGRSAKTEFSNFSTSVGMSPPE